MHDATIEAALAKAIYRGEEQFPTLTDEEAMHIDNARAMRPILDAAAALCAQIEGACPPSDERSVALMMVAKACAWASSVAPKDASK